MLYTPLRTRLVNRGLLFALVCVLVLGTLCGCQQDTDLNDPSTHPAAENTSPESARETPKTPASKQLPPEPDGEPAELSAEEIAAGWLLLFDGQTLFGWESAAKANFRVEDGAIVVDEGEVGLLHTTTPFANYQLHVEFKADPGTNSGVFLHTSAAPKDPARDCYELNIAPADNPYPTGSLVGRLKTSNPPPPGDTWHSFDVTVQESGMRVQLNGEQTLGLEGEISPRRGFIGLQHNQGRVAFRNIKLRPLGLSSIFNGQDLSGWKTYPEMASRFSVNDQGHLHVLDGRGQLETESSYGDFVLQLECFVNGEGLNSGIFFRCIPGDVMMGYESQIQNGYKNNDRRLVEDCGTGGIFRRQDARRIVADDRTWFAKTIIATGPHIATWVNGYPVCDWTDTRAANENPRRGLRTEPGSIMIQGHDPTTDLSFRNLQIMELPPRVQPN